MKWSKRESLEKRSDQSPMLCHMRSNLSCGRPRALFASIDRGAGKPSADYLRYCFHLVNSYPNAAMSPGATLYFGFFAWAVTSLLDGPTVPLVFNYPRVCVVVARDSRAALGNGRKAEAVAVKP